MSEYRGDNTIKKVMASFEEVILSQGEVYRLTERHKNIHGQEFLCADCHFAKSRFESARNQYIDDIRGMIG